MLNVSANSHCRAPLRLPLPPAARICNTQVSVGALCGLLKAAPRLHTLGLSGVTLCGVDGPPIPQTLFASRSVPAPALNAMGDSRLTLSRR